MMVRHVFGMGQHMGGGELAVGIDARGMRIAALRCMEHLQRQAQHQEEKHQPTHGQQCIPACGIKATALVTEAFGGRECGHEP